jgi:hypothetical protein
MTLTVKPMSYTVTVVGGSFAYGMYQVVDSTGAQPTAAYPAHLVINAGGSPVNPATEDTQQLLLTAMQNMAQILSASTVTLTDAFGASPTAVPVTDAFGSSLGQIAS